MKKTLALLLVVLLTVSCVAMTFIFKVDAAADANQPLFANITHMPDMQKSPGSKASDYYAPIWNTANIEANPTGVTEPCEQGYGVEIVGKFDEPTVVGEIVIRSAFYNQRTDGIDVYVSVDGAENSWVLLWQVEMVAQTGPSKSITKKISDTTEYNYIKVEKTKTSYTNWFELEAIGVIPAQEKTRILDVIFENGSEKINDDNNPANIWKADNYLSWTEDGEGSAEIFSRGKLSEPSQITKIDFITGNDGALSDGALIKASTNGTDWETVGELATGLTDYTRYTFNLSGTKEYQYVRVEPAQGKGTISVLQVKVNAKAIEKSEETPQDPINTGTSDKTLFANVTHMPDLQKSPNEKASDYYASIWNSDSFGVYPKSGMDPQENGYGVVVVGKFDEPTVIGELVILTSHYKQRTDGCNFYASVDGTNWVLLYQFRHDTGTGAITVNKTITDTTAFNYIKVEKPMATFSVGASSWFEVRAIGIIPAQENDKLQEVAFEEGSAEVDEINRPANIWGSSNFLTWNQDDVSDTLRFSTGKLENPTKITAIDVFTGKNANLSNNAYVKVSVDGIEWETVGNLGSDLSDYTKYTFNLSGDEEYQYIKIQSTVDGTISIMQVRVYAEGEDETTDTDTETDKPTDTQTASTTETSNNESTTAGNDTTAAAETKKGCKSAFGMGAAALAACATAFTVLKKRREDK